MARKKSSAPAHPSPEEKHLARLEERLAHEILGDEERQELRDRVLRLRRRLVEALPQTLEADDHLRSIGRL